MKYGSRSLWKQKPSLLGASENGAEKGDIFIFYLYVKWNSFGLRLPADVSGTRAWIVLRRPLL